MSRGAISLVLGLSLPHLLESVSLPGCWDCRWDLEQFRMENSSWWEGGSGGLESSLSSAEPGPQDCCCSCALAVGVTKLPWQHSQRRLHSYISAVLTWLQLLWRTVDFRAFNLDLHFFTEKLMFPGEKKIDKYFCNLPDELFRIVTHDVVAWQIPQLFAWLSEVAISQPFLFLQTPEATFSLTVFH